MTTAGNTVIELLPRQAAALCAAPLRRPKILVRAAQAGQAVWRRERDMPALLRGIMPADAPLPGPGGATVWLRTEEDRLNEARREKRGDYDVVRHVTLLIALLSELRVLADGSRQGAGTMLHALPG